MHYKKICGDKIYFSPLRAESIQLITKWANDEDSACSLGNYYLNFTEELEKQIISQKSMDSSVYKFEIHDSKTDNFIGVCDLHCVSFKDRYAEIGYNIGEKDYRNKGYGTEAIKLLCDYAFNILNIKNLVMTIYDFNIASIKCAEKNHFQLTGKIKEKYYCKGKYNDMLFFQLNKSTFEQHFDSIYTKKG